MKKIIEYSILALSAMVALSSCGKLEGVALPAAKGEPGFCKDPYTDNLWLEVQASETGFDATKYPEFIISAMEMGYDQSYVNYALQRLTELQIRDKSNPLCGQINRIIGDPIVQSSFDKNNVEFMMELAAVILIKYRDAFTEENRKLLDDLIDYALYAMYSHDDVAVTYTNIYIMRVWNHIGLGENLPSDRTWGLDRKLKPADIAARGYDYFERFFKEVCANGIHEHCSPTYTGVQAECIGYINKFVKNEAIKPKSQQLTDYFSAMLFANYFVPGKSLGGAQSRCYYRGMSGGKIDQIARGLILGYGMYEYNKIAAWTPTQQARDIADTYPRLVAYTWGNEKQTDAQGREFYRMNAINYVTRKYFIASAGHNYTGNGTEKQLLANVVSKRCNTMVNFAHYLNQYNDPYGFNYSGSHAWQVFHQAYARSQHENEFVALCSGTGRGSGQLLSSDILIPATYVDEIWLGNTKIQDWFSMEGNKTNLPRSGGYTFFVKIDDVVVSVRYLYTFGTDGKNKNHTLTYDTSLRNYYSSGSFTGTALRVSTTLKGSVSSATDLGGVAMWWRVTDGIKSDEDFAALRNSIISAKVNVNGTELDFGSDQSISAAAKKYVAGDVIDVYVTTPEGLKLGVKGQFEKYDYVDNQYIFSPCSDPKVNDWHMKQLEAYGSSVDFSNRKQAFFSVNGKDIGRPLLGIGQ